jgi:cytoskeletal protein CcmA (bactofilin family)
VPEYQVQLDIDGDLVNLHDFGGRDLLRQDGFAVTRTLHRDLEPVQDKLSFQCDFVQSLANTLLTLDSSIIVTVTATRDGDAWFTGYVRPVTSYDIEDDRVINFECLDNGWRLERKPAAAGSLEDNTVTQILTQLLTDAGYSASERDSIGAISTSIPIFSWDARKKTYKKIISELLLPFGYIYYFDAAGKFRTYKWLVDSAPSTTLLDNNSFIGQLTVDRDDDRLGAILDPNAPGEEIVVPTVTTPVTRRLTAWVREPQIERDEDEVWPGIRESLFRFNFEGEFDSATGFTPLAIANGEAEISWDHRIGIFGWRTRAAFARLSATGASVGSPISLGTGLEAISHEPDYDLPGSTLLNLRSTQNNTVIKKVSYKADVTYVTDGESFRETVPFGVKFEIARYLTTETDAKRLLTGLKRRIEQSVYQYSFESEADVAIGDYAQLQSPDLNIDTLVRVIEKRFAYRDGVDIWQYKCEGASELGTLVGSVTSLNRGGVLTSDIIEGSTRANEGLTPGGQVALPVSGNAMSLPLFDGLEQEWDPGETGLFFTDTQIGFYDQPTDSWPVRIENDAGTGKMRVGNDDQFMEWDGSALQIQGTARSTNYSAGSAGWQIEQDGNAEFNDVTVRGTVEADTGEIGAWVVDNPDLRDTDSRILMRPTQRRIEVRDDLGVVKTAMGYLGGLDNPGGGTFDATDFGFLLGSGNSIDLAGTVDFRDGDFLIENDAAIVIRDGAGGERGRFGSLGTGDIGIELGPLTFGATLGGGGATGTFGDTLGGGGATGTFGALLGGGGAEYASDSGFLLSVGNNTFDILANTDIVGDLSVTGNIVGDTDVVGDLSVTGAISAASISTSGSVSVTGDTDVVGDLSVTGAISAASLSTSGGISITGGATIGGSLTVDGVINYSNMGSRNETSLTVPASGSVLIPAGLKYVLSLNSDLSLQVQRDGGIWRDIISSIASPNIGGMVVSDGVHLRVLNTSSSLSSSVRLIDLS